MKIIYGVKIPKSTSKIRRKQMLEGSIYPITRPDLDNLNKLTIDCLKGIVMEDDSQVCQLFCRKFYADKPGISVWIEEILGEDNPL